MKLSSCSHSDNTQSLLVGLYWDCSLYTYKEASVLYSHCDIELVAIHFQVLFSLSIVWDWTTLLLESQPLSYLRIKQTVTHCLDNVYWYNTAGRHLTVGLATAFVYGDWRWSTDSDIGLRTLTLNIVSRYTHQVVSYFCIEYLYSLYAIVIIDNTRYY